MRESSPASKNVSAEIPRSASIIIVVILLTGAAFGSIAFGATQDWSVALLQLCAVAVGGIWLLSGGRDARALLILSLPALFGLLQLLPLPDALKPVFPGAFKSWNSAPGGDDTFRLTCDIGATVKETVRVIMLASVCTAVAVVSRHRTTRDRILIGLALLGVLIFALGVIFPGDENTVMGFHDMTGPIRPWKSSLLEPNHGNGTGFPDTMIVGAVPYELDSWVVGDVFGPYVSSNHFANAMLLLGPAGIALLVQLARRRGPGPAVFAILYAIAIIGVMIFAARSFGGAALLMLTLILFAALATRRRGVRRALLAVAVLLLVGGAIVLILLMQVPESEATAGNTVLDKARSSAAHRMDALRASLRMIEANPVSGVGLGAYRTAYPAFRRQRMTFVHAHNDYVQALAETGFLGALFFVPALLLLIVRTQRGIRQIADESARLTLLAVSLGVLGMALHALIDYNLHVTGNAFLFAILLGILFGAGAREQAAAERVADSTKRVPHIVRLVLVALALGVSAGVSLGMLRTAGPAGDLRAATAERIRLRRAGQPLNDAALHGAIAAAETAWRWTPYEGRLAETIGQGYIELSRGRPSEELQHSQHWYGCSLRLRPGDVAAHATAARIERILAVGDRMPAPQFQHGEAGGQAPRDSLAPAHPAR